MHPSIGSKSFIKELKKQGFLVRLDEFCPKDRIYITPNMLKIPITLPPLEVVEPPANLTAILTYYGMITTKRNSHAKFTEITND